MRFDRGSALDRLADALRRADATWRGGELDTWEGLALPDKERWRAMARTAAIAVHEEMTGEEALSSPVASRDPSDIGPG